MSTTTPIRARAFSLVEVTIALGIFALLIVAIVAMIGPISRESGQLEDRSTATRLAEGISRELDLLGYGRVVAGTDAGAVLRLVANKDGSRVLLTGLTDPEADPLAESGTFPAENALNDPTRPGMADRDRYFLIEVRRMTTVATDPLYHDTGASPLFGPVPLQITVKWPFRVAQTIAPSPMPTAWDDASVQGTSPSESQAGTRELLTYPLSISP